MVAGNECEPSWSMALNAREKSRFLQPWTDRTIARDFYRPRKKKKKKKKKIDHELI